MPIYEFQCDRCGEVNSVLWRGSTRQEDLECSSCAHGELTKLVSAFAVHRNTTSKLSSLDPRYDRMVDKAVKNTPESDPNRHLAKMTPFSRAGSKAGD